MIAIKVISESDLTEAGTGQIPHSEKTNLSGLGVAFLLPWLGLRYIRPVSR